MGSFVLGSKILGVLIIVFTMQIAQAEDRQPREACVKRSQADYAPHRNIFDHLPRIRPGANNSEITPKPIAKPDSPVRVIIGFREGFSTFAEDSSFQGKVIHELPLINSVAAELPRSALDQLLRDPNIRLVEIDAEVHAFPIETIIDSDRSPSQPQTIPDGISRVKAPQAWPRTKGKGSIVAILDTGIDRTHPDLKDRVIGGKNLNASDPDPEAWYDGAGHGTHVAGTIAASHNGIGVVGIAPEASLLAVKVLSDKGKGSYSDIIAGIEYALEAKAHVANLSLSGTVTSKALQEAMEKAHSSGMFVVAAAGNRGEQPGNPPVFPGSYPEVVGVGAIDRQEIRGGFSSYHKYVALSAPGVQVQSTIPEQGYARMSGTSMAAPHVAGAAALLQSLEPWKASGLKDAKRKIVCASSDLWPEGRDVWTGRGLLNIERALSEDPKNCDYLEEEESMASLPQPTRKAEPSPETVAVYVKHTAFNLVNDDDDRALVVTLKLVNQKQEPQRGLEVVSEIMEREVGPLGYARAKTNSRGEARFILTGFDCGRYITRVRSVSHKDFSPKYGQPEAEVDAGDYRDEDFLR
ncbi:MAG: S8 family serine peptidase [Bdellovibrionota bacterium]